MKNTVLYIFVGLIIFSGCETEIHPELHNPEEVIVVDAWLTNETGRQEIKLTRSQPYFENAFPEKISGATVIVQDLDNGARYEFQEGPNSYLWVTPDSTGFGEIGHAYRLEITVDGELFEAYSTLNRVPSVDSILFEYNDSDLLIPQEYFTAEFMARDLEGIGDKYWIKAWKNGEYLSKPGELNMVYDASFTAGQSVDGQPFIIPIRKDFVNPLDANPDKPGEFLPPWKVGDSLYVEIHSLDQAAFDFLFGVYFHINRPGGFAELFAMPLANASTNLQPVDLNSTTNIAGCFNTAAVSGNGKTLTSDLAQQAISQFE